MSALEGAGCSRIASKKAGKGRCCYSSPRVLVNLAGARNEAPPGPVVCGCIPEGWAYRVADTGSPTGPGRVERLGPGLDRSGPLVAAKHYASSGVRQWPGPQRKHPTPHHQSGAMSCQSWPVRLHARPAASADSEVIGGELTGGRVDEIQRTGGAERQQRAAVTVARQCVLHHLHGSEPAEPTA